MAKIRFPFGYGQLFGTGYLLENINDEVPLHTHDVKSDHITIILFGSIKSNNGTVYKSGSNNSIIDWPLEITHGYIALEPNTIVVNIAKTMR